MRELLQTLRRLCKAKIRLRNRPAPPELSGQLLRLRQVTFIICNRSETNVCKIADITKTKNVFCNKIL
mgnify:CR=1 FL=1